MKIHIDTSNKVIELVPPEIYNLGELVKVLSNLLPDGEWKEYYMKITPMSNISSPFDLRNSPYLPDSGKPIEIPNDFQHYPSYNQPYYVQPSTTVGIDNPKQMKMSLDEQ